MKRLSIPAIILAAVPLWAGVRIKAEMTDLRTRQTTQQEILLDNDQLRMNNAEGPGTSVLFLTDRGRERIVVLDSHEYRVLDKQSMEEMSKQIMSQLQL